MKKIILPLILAASFGLSSVSLASTVTNNKVAGVKLFKIQTAQASAAVNCYENLTDVCVINETNHQIHYYFPGLGQGGVIPKGYWIDVYSNNYDSDQVNGQIWDYSTEIDGGFYNHQVVAFYDGDKASKSTVIK